REALVGSYTYGSGPRDHFTIEVRTDMLKREQLTIERAGAPSRQNLYHVGNLVFFPTGVPSTKIAFAREIAKSTRLTVADPNVTLAARRGERGPQSSVPRLAPDRERLQRKAGPAIIQPTQKPP